MTGRILVRPRGRFETDCVVQALRSEGLDADTGYADDVHDLVIELVWPSERQTVETAVEGIPGSGPPVLMCAMDACDTVLLAELATRLGAAGVVRADVDTHALATKVSAFLSGGKRWQDQDVAPPLGRAALTDRERQVADLVADGLSNEVIAQRLGISYNTVRTHIQNLLAKLEAPHRFAVATMVRHHRLLDSAPAFAPVAPGPRNSARAG